MAQVDGWAEPSTQGAIIGWSIASMLCSLIRHWRIREHSSSIKEHWSNVPLSNWMFPDPPLAERMFQRIACADESCKIPFTVFLSLWLRYPHQFFQKKYFWYHGWWLGGGGRRFCRWLQQMVCWDGCSLQFGGVWPSLACRCFHPHKFNYKSFISIHDTLTSVGRDTAYRMWDQSFISIHDTLKLVGRDTAYRMWDQSFISIHDTLKLVGRDTAYRMWDQSLISFHDTLTSVGRDTAYRMWDQSLISFHDTRWHRLGETLHTGCETNL